MILAYIDAYRKRFGVELIYAVLSEHGITIAPGTYYAWRKCKVRDNEMAEAHLVNALVDVHRANRSLYGVRKMWHATRRAGFTLGRDQVARLCESPACKACAAALAAG